MIVESSVISLDEMFRKNINIPLYQRPYRWLGETAIMMYNDIFRAYKDNKKEYRLGTVIFHKNDGKYDTVDGQQRITTLIILLSLLGCGVGRIVNDLEFKKESIRGIKYNSDLIKIKLKSEC